MTERAGLRSNARAVTTTDTYTEGWLTLCSCTGDCRCASEHAAMASAAAILREQVGPQRCDSDGVSNCVRCNTLYLVSVAEKIVEGRLRYVSDQDVERRREAARAARR